MITRLLRRTVAGLLAAVLLAGPLHAQKYDAAPLREPVAMPASGLPADPGEFMAWLASSASRLSQDDVVTIREHLFAIISADAKRRYRETGSAFPSSRDTTLAALFRWADRLGVPGSALVASAIESSGGAPDGTQTPSPGIELRFDSVYTLTAEHDGWRISFPHYFMIGNASRQRADTGADVTTVVLSTLFARDSVDASQATILILSAAVPAPEFAATWLDRLGLQASDTTAVPTPGAVRAYRAVDPGSRMSREMVVLAPEGRTILAIFVGILGTDRANRPHFVDLLETLRVRPPAR